MQKTAQQLAHEVLFKVAMEKEAMEKEALKVPGKAMGGAGQWLKKKFMGDAAKGTKGWLRGAKEMAIGQPIKGTKEIMSGKAWGPKGMLREGFIPQGKTRLGRAASGALMYGFPAYETYKAVTDPGDRGFGENMGRILGSTAGMYGGFKPYGMLGSTLLGGAMGNVGGRIGRLGDKAVKKVMPAQGGQQAQQPQQGRQYGPSAARMTPYAAYQAARQNY